MRDPLVRYDVVSAYPYKMVRPWRYRLQLWTALTAVSLAVALFERYVGCLSWKLSLAYAVGGTFSGSGTYQVLAYFDRRKLRRHMRDAGNVISGRL